MNGLFDDIVLAFDHGTITLSGELPTTLPTWFERGPKQPPTVVAALRGGPPA